MRDADLPVWIRSLDEDDLQLIRRFVLSSGSLKQLASDYEVTYPTIRSRMDSLIERLKAAGRDANDDVLEARLRMLVADGTVSPKVGKELLQLHRQTRGVSR